MSMEMVTEMRDIWHQIFTQLIGGESMFKTLVEVLCERDRGPSLSTGRRVLCAWNDGWRNGRARKYTYICIPRYICIGDHNIAYLLYLFTKDQVLDVQKQLKITINILIATTHM